MSETPSEETSSNVYMSETDWLFKQLEDGFKPKLPELEVVDLDNTEEVHFDLGSTALLEDQDIEPRFAA